MALTHSPDAPHLAAGSGTAAAQTAVPRKYANYQTGGWQDTAPAKATGATAGTPGTFTPAGSYKPANLAAMTGVTAVPATAWTTGQRVVTFDGAAVSWNGTAWVAGQATATAR